METKIIVLTAQQSAALGAYLNRYRSDNYELSDFVFLRPDVKKLEEAEELVSGIKYEWQPQGVFSVTEYLGLLSFTVILEKFLVRASVSNGFLFIYRGLSDSKPHLVETNEADPNEALAALLAEHA